MKNLLSAPILSIRFSKGLISILGGEGANNTVVLSSFTLLWIWNSIKYITYFQIKIKSIIRHLLTEI